MRTKDELFREALRHIAARRQQAVTAAERDRAAAAGAVLKPQGGNCAVLP